MIGQDRDLENKHFKEQLQIYRKIIKIAPREFSLPFVHSAALEWSLQQKACCPQWPWGLIIADGLFCASPFLLCKYWLFLAFYLGAPGSKANCVCSFAGGAQGPGLPCSCCGQRGLPYTSLRMEEASFGSGEAFYVLICDMSVQRELG